VAAVANPTSPPTAWKTRSNSSTSESNSPTPGSPNSAALEVEINARQGHAAQEHQQLDRELLGLEGERRKLLAAYYADAIDLGLLRQEQSRISQRTGTIEARRRSLAANLGEWRAILETAGRFATNCGATYRHADTSTLWWSTVSRIRTPPSSTNASQRWRMRLRMLPDPRDSWLSPGRAANRSGGTDFLAQIRPLGRDFWRVKRVRPPHSALQHHAPHHIAPAQQPLL